MNTLLIIDGENLKGKLKNVFEDAGKDKPIWHKYIGFEVNPNKGISYTTDRTILIRNSEVLEFEMINQLL